jgi:hypothetical protein
MVVCDATCLTLGQVLRAPYGDNDPVFDIPASSQDKVRGVANAGLCKASSSPLLSLHTLDHCECAHPTSGPFPWSQVVSTSDPSGVAVRAARAQLSAHTWCAEIAATLRR